MNWLACVITLVPALLMLPLAVLTRRPALVLVATTFFLAQALPLLSIALADGDVASATLRSYLPDVQWICMLATISFVPGYAIFARWQPGTHRSAFPAARDRAIEHFHLIALSATFAMILIRPGGPIGFISAGFERVPVDDLRYSLAYAFACMASVTTVLLTLRRMQGERHPPWPSMIAIVLLFWVLGGRAQLFVTLASFALCCLAYGRIGRVTAILGIVAFTGLALMTLHFRLSLQGGNLGLSDTFAASIAQVSLLEGYAIAARYFESFGAQPALYLETIQQLVPRALYPEKPVQVSRLLRLMISRDELGGLTAGIYGEFFIVGGYAAVAALGLILAAVLAMLDNAWTRLRGHGTPVQAAVVILVPLLCVFTLRSGFDNSIFRLQITAFVLLAIDLPALLRKPGRRLPFQAPVLT